QIVLTTGGVIVATIALAGAASNLDYSFTSDGGTGTDILIAADARPITTAPKKETVIAKQTIGLSGVSVSDADAVAAGETMTVTVFDQLGRLAVSGAGGAAVTQLTNKRLQLSGTIDEVNAALATLTYTALPTGSASSLSDTVTVKSEDGRGGQ